MDLLLPITTIALIALGALCLFISIDNHSRAIPRKAAPCENERPLVSVMTHRKAVRDRK